MLDDSTGFVMCHECAAGARRHGPSRNPSLSAQITQTLATGAIAFTAATVAAEATRYVQSALPATNHGAKYAGFAMMAVILSLSISATRGEELLFNASSTAQFSTGITGIMHSLQINSGKFIQRSHDMEFLSSMGMTENQCFIDSGCSTSIIHDRSILRNICPLHKPVSVARLVGSVHIHLQDDLHMPVLNNLNCAESVLQSGCAI